MRKVIFLDIDGVLNTQDWHSRKTNDNPRDEFGWAFDPVAVENLGHIVKETGASIVISSSWKFLGMAKLKQMWKIRKLPGILLDITPNTVSDEMLLNANLDEMELGVCRGNEIKEWLSRHKGEVSNYVIIDDFDDLLSEQENHAVLTDSLIGITEFDAIKAIRILNNRSMTKRILVIPDIHGETFWKEPVQKYIDQVDRIVFLGDYLDPYPEEGKDNSPQGLFDNLMDIIDLKRANMDKVVLLKGNHDQHYASEMFRELACGSRCDTINWSIYNAVFVRNHELFKLAHLEEINGIPYLFSHAGLTLNWINKVNSSLWKLADNKISLADPEIIARINALDDNNEGQEMLSIIGRYRTFIGAKSGSVLWADIEEHAIPDAPKAYGLNKVFQVFGHTRLEEDMIEFDNLAMIDSQQCFMIDEGITKRIITLKEYTINNM